MAANIMQWCRDCQHCQQAKVTKQPRAASQHIPIPTRRFSHVHIDLVGPLPRSSDVFNHIFTMVDRSSRWLEAIPMSSTDTTTIAATFTSSWIAASACLTTSPPTGERSFVWLFGQNCHSGGASNTTSLLPTTHKPTGWSREHTASLRTPCGPEPLAATGLLTSLGSYLGCGRLPKTTPTYLQRSWFMEPLW